MEKKNDWEDLEKRGGGKRRELRKEGSRKRITAEQLQ